MEQYFATDCMECGSCSFACPSGIPIVQLIRIGKSTLREKRIAAAQKAQAEKAAAEKIQAEKAQAGEAPR